MGPGEPNRPLWMGDRVWTAAGARAELKTGNAALRLAPETSLSIVAFDDQAAQYEVNQGTVRLRVRSLDRDEAIEDRTPNLAFSIRTAGDYRVDVDSSTTTVAVYRGDGEALGTRNAYAIGAGTRVRFGGTDLGDYQPVPLARTDAFDSWVVERTRFEERSTSVRYVAPEVIGYEDLDAYGTWRAVPDYGNVWIPTRVARFGTLSIRSLGVGRPSGVGRGSTTHRGALRHSTMAGGRSSRVAGAGCRARAP